MKMIKIILILDNATCTSYYDVQKYITDMICSTFQNHWQIYQFKWVKMEKFWILETAEIDFFQADFK